MYLWLRSLLAAMVLFTLLPGVSQAAGLRYLIEGAGKESRENIRAYLGDSLKDSIAAERFLVTAPTRTAQALQALGFYDHEVSLKVDRSRDPWVATISVREGEPLRYAAVTVQLTGEGEGDPLLQNLLNSRAPKVGDVLHHGRYESMKSELQQLATRRGYFDARLEQNRIAIDVAAGEARLILSFDSGPRYGFGTVAVDESLLAPELLSHLLPFQTGDGYEQRLLLELRQRLMRLGYFAGVTVQPDVAARSAQQVPIQVKLISAPRHSYALGLGYSTDTEERVSIAWRSPRLNRYGHSQESVLRWSPVNPQARVTYSIPLDDPANDILQFIARLEDNEFGDLNSTQRELRLRRELTSGASLRGLQLRSLDESWGVFSEDFNARFRLAGGSFSTQSRRGNAVDPSRGLRQFYSVELASSDLGSDSDIARFYGSFTGLHSLGERWRLVARGEAGYLWSSTDSPLALPPSLAFFAGGDNSIRGFAYQSLGRKVTAGDLGRSPRQGSLVVGGTRLLTGSLEIQRYFREHWRGALFVDAGDAFDNGDFETNVGVGFGVHYLSPVGALRFELANPVSDSDGSWRVHINIGAEF
jgi:translocation and assembly module TamA